MDTSSLPGHLVLFDGICHFCNSTVQRIIRNDPSGKFYFIPLQSETGSKMLDKCRHKINADTIIFVKHNKCYTKSDAALLIAAEMKFPYPLLCFGFIVPRFLRNLIYDYIARNRYKWFGKSESCMVPDEKQKARFIG